MNFNYSPANISSFDDDKKIQRIAMSLYDQVNNGSIKLGKVNRNHIIKTTVDVMKEDFNIDINININDHLIDYIGAIFYQMYKTRLVPHYSSLLCPDVDTLKQLYPAFQTGGELSEDIDSEVETLLSFANEMIVAIQIFSPMMQFIVNLVTICVEGESKKYINGSGATLYSKRRFQLFRRFKPISTRAKRRGSDSSCESSCVGMDESVSGHEEKGRVRRRSSCSVDSISTDFDSPSNTNTFSNGSNIDLNNVPVTGMNHLVPLVDPSTYQSFGVSKPSCMNTLFPQVDTFAEQRRILKHSDSSSIETPNFSYESQSGSHSALQSESMPLSYVELQEFVELFAGEADMDLDFDF